MLLVRLEDIDPKFRILTDQLFFTDRTDLDLSSFAYLLNKDFSNHSKYLWDRIERSLEIFWDESFWVNRFELLLSLNYKILDIEGVLSSKFRSLLFSNPSASPKHNNQYVQFIAWAKAKANKKENIIDIRNLLLGLTPHLPVANLIGTVEHFVPACFQSKEEYIQIISKSIGQSARSFEVIKQFEKQGLTIDRAPIFKQAKDLLLKRATNRPNRRSLFAMMNDSEIMAFLKVEYKREHRDRLLALVKSCDYKELEEFHLRNMKNLIELDASIADELIIVYADRLHARGTGDKGANVKRLIRACKSYPQFSPKKVLAYLSANNRMSDIKFMLSAFPDLKKLAAFV